MTDQQQEEKTGYMQTPGALLKKHREHLNLSQQDVASSLNLKPDVISNLENNEFSQIGEPLYIRGYLKACARLYSADDNALLALYDAMQDAPKITPPKMTSFSRRTKLEANDNRLMMVTYLLITVFVIFIGIWTWQQVENAKPTVTSQTDKLSESNVGIVSVDEVIANDSAEPEAESVLSAADAPESDLNPESTLEQSPSTDQTKSNTSVRLSAPTTDLVENDSISDVLVSVETEIVEPQPRDEAPITPSTTSSTTPSIATSKDEIAEATEAVGSTARLAVGDETISIPVPSAEGERVELVVTFGGDCWVVVSDATGQEIANGVKRDGKVMLLTGYPPFNFTLGAPEVVEIVYDGKLVDQSLYSKGRVARFTLPFEE